MAKIFALHVMGMQNKKCCIGYLCNKCCKISRSESCNNCMQEKEIVQDLELGIDKYA